MFYIRKKVITFLLSGTILSLTGCQTQVSELTLHDMSSFPVQIAIKAMGEHFQKDITHLTISQHPGKGESPDTVIVTITESELPDDSVAAQRTIFSLVNREGQWVITRQQKMQKCYPQRGAQIFSSQPCL